MRQLWERVVKGWLAFVCEVTGHRDMYKIDGNEMFVRCWRCNRRSKGVQLLTYQRERRTDPRRVVRMPETTTAARNGMSRN